MSRVSDKDGKVSLTPEALNIKLLDAFWVPS